MAMADELEISRQKRAQVLGSTGPAAPIAAKTEPEGLLARTARRVAGSKTRAADQALQDQYRTRKGLDQFNRPVKKTAMRPSGR